MLFYWEAPEMFCNETWISSSVVQEPPQEDHKREGFIYSSQMLIYVLVVFLLFLREPDSRAVDRMDGNDLQPGGSDTFPSPAM